VVEANYSKITTPHSPSVLRVEGSHFSEASNMRAIVLRSLDVIIAISALIFLFPLMAATAVIVFLQDGGPIFYAQRRIGYRGRKFACFKFRSMVIDSEARLKALLDSDPEARAEWDRDHKLRRDPRITAFGAFLRKSSIDELPQFFNVLRGEMSVVGPRPIVDSEVPRYGWRFQSYISVRPGLTGLWQVMGRNNTTYRRRVAIDHVFARSLTVRRYIWILIMTIPAVLLRRGSF